MTIYVPLKQDQIEILKLIVQSSINRMGDEQRSYQMDIEEILSVTDPAIDDTKDILKAITNAEHGVFIPDFSINNYNVFTAKMLVEILEISLEEAEEFLQDENGYIDCEGTTDALESHIENMYETWISEKNNNNNNKY